MVRMRRKETGLFVKPTTAPGTAPQAASSPAAAPSPQAATDAAPSNPTATAAAVTAPLAVGTVPAIVERTDAVANAEHSLVVVAAEGAGGAAESDLREASVEMVAAQAEQPTTPPTSEQPVVARAEMAGDDGTAGDMDSSREVEEQLPTQQQETTAQPRDEPVEVTIAVEAAADVVDNASTVPSGSDAV